MSNCTRLVIAVGACLAAADQHVSAQLIDASAIQSATSSRSGGPMMITTRGRGPLYQTPIAMRGMQAEDIAQVFLNEHGRLMGITNAARELSMRNVQTDTIGFAHTTYDQVHNGIPVFSGVVKVHQDPFGNISSLNGRFYPISAKLNVTPLIDAAAAERIASGVFPNIETHAFHNQLVIVDPGWYGDPPKGARIAYYIKLKDSSFQVEEGFFIDARSGEILDHWTLVHRARNRQIFDGAEGTTLPGTISRGEGQNPVASPVDTNRAYDYYGDTYDYYFRAFGRDSINGLGMPMIATVRSMAPACPNAFWSGALGQMVFCTGTVTDDIVGHELTHGVTELTSGLVYQNQSGQLNESLSDIFGEMIDLFNGNAAFAGTPGGSPSWPTHPTGAGVDTPNGLRTACSSVPTYPNGVRWMLGEDATAFGGAIRDMWNPTCFGDPDRANSPLNNCEWYDSGGVHFGSGIPNHAFAIMVDGKTFNGYTVTGIGPIKAGAIWYRAQTQYLTPGSGFEDAYWAINQAATDLIGTAPKDPRSGNPSASAITIDDATQVDQALIAVEMNTPGACGQMDILSRTPPTICSNRVVLYSEDFEGDVSAWQRTTSTPPPPTQYQWVQTISPLPFGRSGKAMFCDDLNSSCESGEPDQSATHSLTSPSIIMPVVNKPVYVAFTHLMMSEGNYDGGNLKYSVNNGTTFAVIPRSMFIASPTNGRIRDLFGPNSNPIKGQDAWTGVGGGWGTTLLIDKTGIFSGQTVKFRFDFGKDYCAGFEGWYVDDFEVFTCPDCANDGVPNDASSEASFCSPIILGYGVGSTRQFGIAAAPQALSEAKLTFFASGDLFFPDEFLTIKLGDSPIGTLYSEDGDYCSAIPERAGLTVSAATLNAARDPINGNLVIKIEPSSEVDSGECGTGNNAIGIQVEYQRSAEVCVPPVPPVPIVFGDFPDVALCVNTATAPLGPDPLFSGGAAPYVYSWRVTAGDAAFDPAVVHSMHPTIKPTVPGESTIELEVIDSSSIPQTVIKTFKLLAGEKVAIDQGAYTQYHPIITVGESLQFGKEFTAIGGLAPYSVHWSIVDNPNGYGTIENADAAEASFSTTQPGTYTLQLDLREAGGCTSITKFSLTAVANGPVSRTSGGANGGGPAGQGVTDACGAGAAACGPTGIIALTLFMVGYSRLRSRIRKRR